MPPDNEAVVSFRGVTYAPVARGRPIIDGLRPSRAPRAGRARAALKQLARRISTEEMRRLNDEVDDDKRAPADVVRDWRRAKGFQ